MNGKKSNVPDFGRLGLAVAGGTIVLLSLSAGAAWMVQRGWMARENMGLAAAAILLSSGFVGAVICGRGGGLLMQALSGLGVMLVLMGLNLALFDGDLRGLVPCGIALWGGVGAGALTGCLGRKKRGHYYKPKSKYR